MEAVQISRATWGAVLELCGDVSRELGQPPYPDPESEFEMKVHTPAGLVAAREGDWIARDCAGGLHVLALKRPDSREAGSPQEKTPKIDRQMQPQDIAAEYFRCKETRRGTCYEDVAELAGLIHVHAAFRHTELAMSVRRALYGG